MKEVRSSLNNYFQSKSLFRGLMSVDFVFTGAGLLLMLVGIIFSVGIDLFTGLGFWLFWLGIILSLAKNNDLMLLIGFGVYGLMNLVGFVIAIIASVRFSSYYGGFYFSGFTYLLNFLVAGLFVLMLLKSSEYIKEMNQRRMEAAAIRQQQMQAQAQAQAQAQQAAMQANMSGNACSNCGTVLADGIAFCPSCGQKVPEKRKCKNCGAPLLDDARFCPSCGTDNSQPETVSEPEVSQEPISEENTDQTAE